MSGHDIKPRLPRMPGRARPSLIAAAQSQPEPEAAAEAAAPEAAAAVPAPVPARAAAPATGSGMRVPAAADAAEGMDVDPTPDVKPAVARAPRAPPALSRSTTGGSTATPASAEAAPAPAPAPTPAPAPSSAAPKMKFKPKMPVRRAVHEDVKPDLAAIAAVGSTPVTRGRPASRARGRGAGPSRGGRTRAAADTVAAGPFGGSRANSSRRFVAPAAPPRYQPDNANIEVYSDNEDGTRAGVIDIEAVSALSESAPTSVYRDRDLDGGKAKAKEMEKTKLKELKKKKKAQLRMREAVLNSGAGGGGPSGVKAEPESPLRSTAILADPNAGVPAPLMRVGDEMIPADEQQDRDAAGRRVRATTSGMDTDMTRESEEVNAAHAINLSESESEDEEEDMEGDFVFVDGNDNPEDKLFTFQFPSNMPKFVAPAPPPDADADADGDVAMASAELKPETKPAATHLKKRRNPMAPPPEGRIGTLVVMKSGKVKMVMGEGANAIVMNVTPGVPNTFLQQIVHLDNKQKSTTVLGEVHKQYTVTPDVDRLLEELFLNDGETPGDRERKRAADDRRLRAERGLVKMEMSSP